MIIIHHCYLCESIITRESSNTVKSHQIGGHLVCKRCFYDSSTRGRVNKKKYVELHELIKAKEEDN